MRLTPPDLRLCRVAAAALAVWLSGCQGLRTEAHNEGQPGPIRVWRLTERDGLSVARGYAAAIDLTDPRVELVVTDPDTRHDEPGPRVRLEPTDDWAARHDLTLAINANYFGQIDPQSATARILGLCVSDGKMISPPRTFDGLADPALAWIDGKAVADRITAAQAARAQDAVAGIGGSESAPGGFGLLVDDGRNTANAARVAPHQRHPRTAAGVDAVGQRLLLVVIDGRQPGHSRGMTLPQLADLMIQLGAYDAVNLDGGGSSSFWYADPTAGGTQPLTNRPSEGHFRPVAVHLGIRLHPGAVAIDRPPAIRAGPDPANANANFPE